MFIFADMDKETYEKQKAFAGEKRSSMKRRYVGHDYTGRMMYMVTMVVEGRRPLFGAVVGRSDAPPDSEEAPRMELSELGRRPFARRESLRWAMREIKKHTNNLVNVH